MEKKYIILNVSEINTINFSKVIEDSKETLRYNMNHTEIIVKFIGETPSFLDGKKQYSHTEIINLINNPDNGWIEN